MVVTKEQVLSRINDLTDEYTKLAERLVILETIVNSIDIEVTNLVRILEEESGRGLDS